MSQFGADVALSRRRRDTVHGMTILSPFIDAPLSKYSRVPADARPFATTRHNPDTRPLRRLLRGPPPVALQTSYTARSITNSPTPPPSSSLSLLPSASVSSLPDQTACASVETCCLYM